MYLNRLAFSERLFVRYVANNTATGDFLEKFRQRGHCYVDAQLRH